MDGPSCIVPPGILSPNRFDIGLDFFEMEKNLPLALDCWIMLCVGNEQRRLVVVVIKRIEDGRDIILLPQAFTRMVCVTVANMDDKNRSSCCF